jgi:predicted ester cyclase
MHRTPLGGIMLVASIRWRQTLVGWERRREAPVSEAEVKNKALVRRYFEEVWSKGNVAALDEMLTPDFVDHDLLPGQGASREEYKRSVTEFHAAFSHTGLTIEDQIVQGDKVVTKFSMTTTHRGTFLGTLASGEEGIYSGIRIHRIVGDKITDEWSEGNLLGVLLPSFEREIQARERAEQELRLARSIQQASLPREVPKLEGWQVTPYYRSAREVGGDFYDFHLLSKGRLGVVVGDATGKGMPAALVMSTTCGMLQLAAQAMDSSSPGEILSRVNETLLARIPPNMFVTCFYAILDPKSGALSYANAGHDVPYLHRNDYAEELRARGMPLGLMPEMSYEEKKTTLAAGESALFYSDGLVEAHNPQREMFGFPRLRALVAEHAEEGSLVNLLLEELRSFTGEGWEQEDDITLLTLECSPT